MSYLKGLSPVKNPKYEKLNLNTQSQFSIGRFEGASCQIRDVKVSRKPALFDFKDQEWYLTDKESMNGVFVNEIQIPSCTPVLLKHGDIIKLGPIDDYRWKYYKYEESSSPPPKKKAKVVFEQDAEMERAIKMRLETEMKETISKLEKERQNLICKVESSEKVTEELREEKNSLLQTLENQKKELILKQQDERNSMKDKLKETQDLEADKELSSLETRLLKEKEDAELKSKRALEEVERKISEAEKEKNRIALENQKIIKSLQNEKTLAEKTLIKEKEILEEKFKSLRNEYEENTREKESYKEAMLKISTEMEAELNEGRSRLESVIEKEKQEKENLQIEFDKVKAQNDEAVRKLDSMLGTCEEELKCTICDEIFINPMTTNCGHVFCQFCLNQWKQKSKSDVYTCPNCRNTVSTVNKNLYLGNLIDSLLGGFSDEVRSQRELIIQKRNSIKVTTDDINPKGHKGKRKKKSSKN